MSADLLDAPPLPVAENALVVIPRAELIFVPGGAEKVLNSIKDKARRETAGLDVSRPRDRDAMRSVAYKLRRLKTTGDDSGKDLKAEYQAKINPIDAERRVWRAEMDELIAEIIAPAEKFDADEAARVKGHEDALADVLACCVPEAPYTSGMLRLMLDAFGARPTREWQEFSQRATDADAYVRRTLLHMIEVTETAEREAAEFARLREEEAERQRQEAARLQAEREAEIARQAAETARVEAERVAVEEAARVAAQAEEARLAAERAAQAADYHRRMLQHVKNCGFGFIDEQPQPLGILQHELTAKITYDEENFGDLLAEAIVARDEALRAIQRSIDESNRRAAEEEAAAAALAKERLERACGGRGTGGSVGGAARDRSNRGSQSRAGGYGRSDACAAGSICRDRPGDPSCVPGAP